DLTERLRVFGPVLKGQWERLNLKALFQGLERQLSHAASEPDAAAASESILRMAARLAESLRRFSVDSNDYQSPWVDLMTIGGEDADAAKPARYFLNEKGTIGFLMAASTGESNTFDGPAAAIARLRELAREAQLRFPEARIGVT